MSAAGCSGRRPGRRCWRTIPTTRRWFTDRRILPGLARATGSAAIAGTLQLVAERDGAAGAGPARRAGHRLGRHRQPRAGHPAARRRRPVAVRDEAARYADAGAVGLSAAACRRSTAVAVVLDRVPTGGQSVEVTGDLAGMLTEHGLGGAPLFVVPEATPMTTACCRPTRSSRCAPGSPASPPTHRRALGRPQDPATARVPLSAARAHSLAAAAMPRHDAAMGCARGR